MFKKDSKYVHLGVTLLLVIIISVLFGVTLINIGTVYSELRKLIGVFSFVIYGVIFAYLMNPVMMLVEKLVQKLLARSNITERSLRRLSRVLGVISAVLTFGFIIYGLLAMVIPQLIDSITETFSQENLQNYYVQITTWLNDFAKGSFLEEWIAEHDPVRAVQNWLTKELDIFSTIGTAFTEVYGVAKTIFNMFIGLVVAVYLLISKEKFISQTKKLVVAVFKTRGANRLFEVGRLANQSFGGFMVGKVIDSFIIGLISYVGMIILDLPYALLSSALVGLTNIIPFFGPLIGIVIGGILIVLQSPIDALYFLIFELILQQVDGNIIGPKILGDRLGISDFWILVSITVFGSLFGFGGMLLGVPVFTVIYALISQAVNNALSKKNLPQNSEHYYSILTVEDLKEYDKEFGEPTVFYSGDTFETEYDPDDDFEFDDSDA
ncbi:MAG: AI-2E family transporter [Oscillospiraceae bacterium]|nr:AI-2E family transporter [Oscillospiraceae bacterium]